MFVRKEHKQKNRRTIENSNVNNIYIDKICHTIQCAKLTINVHNIMKGINKNRPFANAVCNNFIPVYTVIQREKIKESTQYSAEINKTIKRYNQCNNVEYLMKLFDLIENLHLEIENSEQLRSEISRELTSDVITSQIICYGESQLYGITMLDGSPVHTKDNFKKVIGQDLSELCLGSKTFRTLVKRLLNRRRKGLNVTLYPTGFKGHAGMITENKNSISISKGNIKGKGENVEITLDTTSDYFGDNSNSRKIALAHELIHALHALYGMRMTSDVDKIRNLKDKKKWFYNGATEDDIPTIGNIPASFSNFSFGVNNVEQIAYETYASISNAELAKMLAEINENRIRKEMGIQERIKY